MLKPNGAGRAQGETAMSGPKQLASTMSQSSGKSWALKGGATFTQAFRVKEDGWPTRLVVRMGNNQAPYSALLSLQRGDELLLQQQFDGCRQRQDDWATEFNLRDLAVKVKAGEWLSFALTPGEDVGIEPLTLSDPDYVMGSLEGYGPMVARFALEGAPDDEDVPTPIDIDVDVDDGPRPNPSLQDVNIEGQGVGEGVICTALNSVDAAVYETDWRFGPDNGLYLAFIQSNALGQLTPLPEVRTTPRSLTVYPFEAGQYPFEVDVHFERRNRSRGTETLGGALDIATPTIAAQANLRPLRTTETPDAPARLCVGDYYRNLPGFGMRCVMTSPGGLPGRMAAIQLVNGLTRIRRRDGQEVFATTGGAWYLDNATGFPADDVTYGARSVTVLGGGQAELALTDTPNVRLGADCVRVELDETFRTFICFKSALPGAVWASIGYFEWRVRGVASRADTGAAWGLEPGFVPNSMQTVNFVQSPLQPQWTGNTRTLAAILNAGFPEPDFPICIALGGAGVLVLVVLAATYPYWSKSAVSSTASSPAREVGPGRLAVWCQPEQVASLQSIEGVASAAVVAPAQRVAPFTPKTRRQEELYAQLKKFVCEVSPHNLFGPSPAPDEIALCPVTLTDVGVDLMRRAVLAGATVTVTRRDACSLNLTFASHPTDAQLAALAACPYVYLISPRPDFDYDDPEDDPDLQ